jgi:hypothetical protein
LYTITFVSIQEPMSDLQPPLNVDMWFVKNFKVIET